MKSMVGRLLAGVVTLLLCLGIGATSASAGPVYVSGDAGVTSEAFGALDVFVAGSDGDLYHRSLNGGWWGYADLGHPNGANVIGKPSAVSWGAGHVDVFVRGSDNYVYHRWFGNGAWWPWAKVGNNKVSRDPVAKSWGNGRIDLFAPGVLAENGNLRPMLHAWLQTDVNGGQWNGWGSLGGDLASRASVVSWNPNHLDVFARGSDGRLWHIYWDTANWVGWSLLSSSAIAEDTDIATVTWGSGTIQAFFTRAGDGHLMDVPFVSGYGGWSAEQDFGGVLLSSPTAMTWQYGHTDVYARGTDGRIYHRWMNASYGNAWWPWEAVGSQTTVGDPTVFSFGNGYADMFARDGGGSLVHDWVNQAVWQPWDYMSHPPDRDTTLPSVTLGGELSEFNDDEVYNTTYSISASASDDVGVAGIDAYEAGAPTPFAHISGASGTLTFNGSSFSNGPHVIQLTATDTSGNVGFSNTITVHKEDVYPDDKDVVTEGYNDVDLASEGGDCGLGVGVACPTSTDRAAYGGQLDLRTWSVRSSNAALNGKQLFGAIDRWLGLSEQHAVQQSQAMTEMGGNLRDFRVAPRWDIESTPHDDGNPDTDNKYEELVKYVQQAKAAGRRVLVSLDHVFGVKSPPTETQYQQQVTAFVNDPNFAGVDFYTAWNEPNFDTNPNHVKKHIPVTATQQGAVRSANYHRIVSRLCYLRANPCHVLAGDFSDNAGGQYFKRYLKNYIQTANDTNNAWGKVGNWSPKIEAWAVHLHAEANAGVYTSGGAVKAQWLDNFITQTGGTSGLPIWITEVGAKSRQPVRNIYRRDAAGQQVVVNRFFDIMADLVARHPRINRLFYYHWQGDTIWDSGLRDLPVGTAVSPGEPVAEGKTRKIYDWFKWLLALEDLNDPHIHSGPQSLMRSTSTTIEFDAPPAPMTTECRMDGGAWQTCTSPKTFSGLGEGGHNYEVQVVAPFGDGTTSAATPLTYQRDGSNSGLPGDEPARDGSFTVDLTAPDTTLSSQPSALTSATSATFAFAATDAHLVGGYQCQLDGGAWNPCTSTKTITGLATGTHTFNVRAYDEVGNVEDTPASVTWKVDATPPNTTIASGPAVLTASTSGTVTFSGTDDLAVDSYECRLDGGAWAACASPKALSGLASGAHTYDVRAKDTAGNVDPTPATVSWTVDATAPDTTITTAPPSTTSATTASIAFTGSDANGVASYECQLDAGAWAACTSPKALSGLASGSHTFKVRAKDGAGNVDATPASATWTVAASGVILGNQTIESQIDSNSNGSAEAWPYTASAAGTATSITAYLDPTSTAGDLKVGLYSDGSSKPGTLLATGSVTSPGTGWVTVPLGASPSIVSGTRYWLALMSTSGTIKFRDHLVGGSCTGHAAGSGLTAMATTWGTDFYTGTDCPGSVYLTATLSTDTTAPDTSITTAPPASTSSPSASVAFTGTDNVGVTSYECRLDGGSWAACTSPKALNSLAAGSHTFDVRAKDAAGNVDATPASATWTVTIGPVLLGSTAVGPDPDPIGPGQVEAWPYTATASGTTTSAKVYIDAGTTATNLYVGVYSNASAKPSALLASGSVSSLTPGGWATVPLSGASLTSGTAYWIGVMSTTSGLRLRDTFGGSCTARALDVGYTALPTTWGTETYSGNECPMSAYITAP